MRVHLRYGRDTLPVDIPHSVEADVIKPPSLPPVQNLEKAITSALKRPVGAGPLGHLLPPSGDVAVVVSDKTRPCSYPIVLPILLNSLNRNGVPDNRILLLVAYGAHRHHTEKENRLFYGEEVLRRARLFHHDSRDASQLRALGETARGTQVRLNRRYLAAAASILIGNVSFHYFAGFGGGRKMIFPGLASEQAILRNHRIFVEATAGSYARMRRFKANIEDHPLNDDLMEAVAMAPPSFVLNFCLNREGEVASVFGGHWKESHSRACQFLSTTCIRATAKYDLVIASCGGHPKDINFIQSHKTIDNAFDLVRSGGSLLVLASCEDGIGSQSFLPLFEHGGVPQMREALLNNYTMNGGTALALRMKAEASRIYLHSSLDASIVEKIGLRPAQEVQRTLDEILAEHDIKTVAVLPEGAVTVVRRE